MRPGVFAVVGGEDDDRVLRHVARQGGEDLSDPLIHDLHDVGVGIEAPLPVAVGRNGDADIDARVRDWIALDREVGPVWVFLRVATEDRCRRQLPHHLGGGLVVLLILFAILYIIGVNPFLCVALITGLGFVLFTWVYHINNKYGEYGIMKKIAKRSMPTVIKSYSRQVFLKVRTNGESAGRNIADNGSGA